MGSDLPQIQNNNPNLTAAYLLKEDGLEKLDNSGRLQLSAVKSNNVQDNYKLEEKMSPDRLPTRKIVPGIDNNSRLVDVVNIGIKADGRKANSKRKSW